MHWGRPYVHPTHFLMLIPFVSVPSDRHRTWELADLTPPLLAIWITSSDQRSVVPLWSVRSLLSWTNHSRSAVAKKVENHISGRVQGLRESSETSTWSEPLRKSRDMVLISECRVACLMPVYFLCMDVCLPPALCPVCLEPLDFLSSPCFTPFTADRRPVCSVRFNYSRLTRFWWLLSGGRNSTLWQICSWCL